MPLTKDENTIASRILLEASRHHTEANKQLVAAEKAVHERRVGEGRRLILSSQSNLRQISTSLDDLRKQLNLEDPKETRKGELSERYKKAHTDLQSARSRKKQLEDTGENDPNILQAVAQVITRYEQALSQVTGDMESDGWSPMDIAALRPKNV